MDRKHLLEELLHANMPITAAMGFSVAQCDDRCVSLSVPLVPNVNHTGTAFAGSVNAAVTVAGWCVIWTILEDAQLNASTVIQDSSIEYFQPITGDFAAQACRPAEVEVSRFLTLLRRRGRARLALRAEIRQAAGLAVSFNGRYVTELAADQQNRST